MADENFQAWRSSATRYELFDNLTDDARETLVQSYLEDPDTNQLFQEFYDRLFLGRDVRNSFETFLDDNLPDDEDSYNNVDLWVDEDEEDKSDDQDAEEKADEDEARDD